MSVHWPALFAIQPIAQWVVAFVPKLQVRQWVRDASEWLQYELCSWMQKSDIDMEIQLAILTSRNVLCYRFLFCNLRTLFTFPIPNMLAKILHEAGISVDGYYQIPVLAVVRGFAKQWPNHVSLFHVTMVENFAKLNKGSIDCVWNRETIVINIRNCLMSNLRSPQTCELLNRYVSLLQEPLEIGDFLHFDVHSWSLLRPHVVSGILTLQNAPSMLLAHLSFEDYCMATRSTESQRHVFDCSVFSNNWVLASKLWCSTKLDESSKELPLKPRICGSIAEEEPETEGWFHGNCNFSKTDDQIPLEMKRLNLALEFVDQQPIVVSLTIITLKDAICTFVARLFAEYKFQELLALFQHSCNFGFFNILSAIWNYCPQHKREFIVALRLCRFCFSEQCLQFAWSHIKCDIREDAMRWIQCAFNRNNGVVWKFLFDKGILSHELSFSRHLIYTRDMQPNVVYWGLKSLGLLATVWPTIKNNQNSDTIHALLSQDTSDHNYRVVSFLNEILFERVTLHCAQTLAKLIDEFQNVEYVKQWDAYEQYASDKTSATTRERMWFAVPIAHPLDFLQHMDPCFDMCLFLLQKQAIRLSMMIHTLKTKPKPNTLLIDRIQAHTYCDADEI